MTLNSKEYTSEWVFFFDFVRTIAIISVVMSHVVQSYTIYNSYSNDFLYVIFYAGRYGVELFFFLSGALLYKQYIDSSYKQANNIFIKRFILNRIARIYPLWVAFLLFYFLIFIFFNRGGIQAQSEKIFSAESLIIGGGTISYTILLVIFILHLSFFYWIFPGYSFDIVPGGWSIQLEMFNYALFAYLIKFGLRKIIYFTLTILFIGSVFIKLESDNGGILLIKNYLFNFNIISSFTYFLLGIIFFHVSCQMKKKIFSILVKEFYIYFIFGVLLIMLLIFHPIKSGSNLEGICFITVSLIFAKILLFFTNFINYKSFFMIIAKHSYTVYFLHFIVISFFIHAEILHYFGRTYYGLFSLTATILAISLVFSFPIYRFYDFPLRQIIRSYGK